MEQPVTSHYSEEICRAAAAEAGLRYVKDTIRGIQRKRVGKGFSYVDGKGEKITDPKTIARIKALVLPPAYRHVWICPFANGHLQATGIDAMGRKQYRYHAEWSAIRDSSKFDRLSEFGEVLPALREHVEKQLAKKELTRERVLAGLIYIMDKSYVRVGNSAYSEQHNTFGLTTLRRKHVHVEGNTVEFSFNGKNGTPWNISLRDRKLVRLLKQCEEIPGYEVFKYRDEHGVKQDISSQDLNAYLREVTGGAFTAKDFRTWAACFEAFSRFQETPVPETVKARNAAARDIIREVASTLGHTQAVCKKAYLHPAVITAWEKGDLELWCSRQKGKSGDALFLSWWKAHIL